LDTETSKFLRLPPEKFVEALGLGVKPVLTASPPSPFVIPERGCSARCQLDSFAVLHGGSDEEKMTHRLTIGQLLEHVLDNNEKLLRHATYLAELLSTVLCTVFCREDQGCA
jgi:hypothetical protein